MARIADPTKLENIKKATISIIVERGYSGASISAIANKAGVAEGYLYRHYQSKTELVKDLFNESASIFIKLLNKELETYTSFKSFVTRYHRELVAMINENPDNTKFFIQLINDFTFEINGTEVKDQTLALCQQLLELGQKNQEISDSCSLIDIYSIVIIIPLQTFSFLLKGFFGEPVLDMESAEKVTQTCLKIVRK